MSIGKVLALFFLFLGPAAATDCLEVSLDPSDAEIPWKTNVTFRCECICESSCKRRNGMYNVMDLYKSQPDGKSSVVEGTYSEGNGTHVIVPHEIAAIQNQLKYFCMVSRVGVSKQVKFTVIEPPPIITNFVVAENEDSISSRSVDLTWAVPDFYPESTQITIDVLDTHTGEKETRYAESVSQTEMRVDGLLPNRRYKFVITNYNKVGTRGSSHSVSAKTDEGVPDGAPQNVTVESISPEELQISWAPPADEVKNGVITGYELHCAYQCEEEDCNTGEVRSISVKTSQLGYVFDKLQENSFYACQVRASTAVGSGPYSDPELSRTQKKPVPCEGGHYRKDAETCLPCAMGFYSAENRLDSCLPCPNGTVVAEGEGAELEDCITIPTQPPLITTTETPISLCEDGQYESENGTCLPCQAGFYSRGNICKPCPDGETVAEGEGTHENDCIPVGGFKAFSHLNADLDGIEEQLLSLKEGFKALIGKKKVDKIYNSMEEESETPANSCEMGQYSDRDREYDCSICPDGTTVAAGRGTEYGDCINLGEFKAFEQLKGKVSGIVSEVAPLRELISSFESLVQSMEEELESLQESLENLEVPESNTKKDKKQKEKEKEKEKAKKQKSKNKNKKSKGRRSI